MINILICDDDKDFLSMINNSINNIISKGKYSDFEYQICCFDQSMVASEYCLENTYDISFLDIDMPDLNGFELAKAIHNKNEKSIVIFVTSFDNFVYTSLRYKPFRFIRKTHIADELGEALQSALNEFLCKYKFLELGKKYYNEKIYVSDIIYFESRRNYVEIVCLDGEKIKYRSTLSNLEIELKSFDFIRVHSGYLVNMKHINKINRSIVELCNNDQISISKRHYQQVHKDFAEYLRR